jgi:L-amino acid N-acyltransferase YncA
MAVEITRASSDEDIQGIYKLHRDNLLTNLTAEEKETEGFVTAVYDMSKLWSMHTLAPAVIARDGSRVVGYVLAAPKSYRGQHQLLDQLMDAVDKLEYKNACLAQEEYVLCGQLCVAKGYRGQGIVQRMYQFFNDEFRGQYSYCITDVASTNPRSLKAHLKSGFEVINSTAYDGVTFDIILWDWNKQE